MHFYNSIKMFKAATQLSEYERIMGGATILASDDHWYQGLIGKILNLKKITKL